MFDEIQLITVVVGDSNKVAATHYNEGKTQLCYVASEGQVLARQNRVVRLQHIISSEGSEINHEDNQSDFFPLVNLLKVSSSCNDNLKQS